MNNLIKKKMIVIWGGIFLLIFFFLRDFKELIEFWKFDINASDLTGDGTMLRNEFFSSYYDPAVLFNFLVNSMVLVFPIIFAVSLYYYNKLRTKCLKYLIGKSRNINKYFKSLKIKISLLSVFYIYVVLLAYTLASYIITGFNVREGADFDNWFFPTSIVSFVNGSFYKFLILYYLVVGIYTFLTSMLLFTIVDYGYNYIYVAISYILLTYVVEDFVIMYISRYLRPSGSLTWLAGADLNRTTFITYIYMLIIYIMFRITHKKEY